MSQILIDRLLETTIKKGASDLHLHVGRPPVLRLDGHLRDLATKTLEPEDTMSLMKSITPDRNQQELQECGSTDFGFAFASADGAARSRFRVAVFRQKGFVSIVMRKIPYKLLTFEEIGLPPICAELCRRPRGLFLVTGPTGSGKTTSLATMINYINENFERHIQTVEDPLEYYHEHKKSMITQREVGHGNDVTTFSESLRRVLRQDPDVILVGEMRDLETISSAITAAETGHLVFATLHTSGAASTINRVVDAFPVSQQEQIRVQLSTTLLAILSQALLPRCDTAGVVAAYEFLVITPAIANLIRENKSFRIDSSIQIGKKFGMQLLDDHLLQLYRDGKVSAEDAVDRSRHPAELAERMGARLNRPDTEKDESTPSGGSRSATGGARRAAG
ncbi:MAG: PilT/PilU family type 4a pilus ATPase [Planctomycetes bacterium]|jgi:twitching motility protein PilT|nr:PilT/PilU family type 4a pilus ATPase [Planctomycetota bacterium]MDA8378128.1 PilT/PilU family type 4a pilus ATPase [Planctomycetia bacterium]